MRLKPPTILLLSLLLTACGTTVSNTQIHCPPLAEYTADQERGVADDMLRMPEPTAQMITDYGRLRNECRAIP